MARIYVDKGALKAPYNKPPIVVEMDKGDTVAVHEVEILGPSRLVHDREATRAPHVYLECPDDLVLVPGAVFSGHPRKETS